ncbi:MAG: alpha-2-macroglobulin family protein, partial [Armatimonadota bacterium]
MKGTQEPSFQPAPLPPLARVIFGLRPRSASVLAAAVLIAGALAFALAEQTPVGRVQGEVVRIGERTPIAGAQIILTPAETEGVAKRLLLYAQTRENGRFSLAHVPAGLYQVSAYLDTYTVAYADLTVDEGRTATVRLELNTARPQLQVVGPQRLFATAERVILPVRGYVDSTAPAPQRAIHVRIYRTRLSAVLKDPLAARALDRIGNDWEPPMALPDALLKPRSGAAPQLLWERDLRIVEAGAEGFYTKRIEVGRPGVGLYLVEARYARTTISTWMLVTDTALVLKRSPGELLAYVADVQTGVPAPGSVVSLHRQGQALGRRRTGADGIARFTLPETEGEFHLVAVARRGNDEAVVAGTDYRFEDGGEFVLFAYTERPIYRPGQRIYYKGLARRKTAREIEYLVPASQAVTVEVRDPGGDLVFREQRKTNAFGSFHGQFDLSPEAPTGTYGMSLSAGATTSTHDIVIASYRKPEFTVTVAPEKPRYTTGDTVKMNVSAQFFFGAPVAGGSVSYLVYRSPDWASAYLAREGVEPDDEADSSISYSGDGRTVAEGKVQLDESGKAVLTFSADVPTEPDSPQDQIFTVQATVTDASGREASAEEIVEVVAGGFRLVAITDGHVVAPGKPTRVRLVARDYEGHPVPNQKVTLEANYLVWNSKNREYASLSAGGQATVTGPDGTATVAVTLPRGGYVRLVARATDSKGREIRASDFVWAAEGTTSDLGMKYARLSLLSDRRRYRQGETARVLINTDRVGQTVLLTVEGAKVYRAITVPITQRSTVVSVPILGAYGRNVFLSALYVKDKRLATSDLTLSVAIPQTEVKVSIRSDRSRYGPGEKVTYAVETTDAQGRPLPAEFSLGVVDESIYALQEDDPKALRNAFYPRRWNMVRTSFSNELRYLGDADKAAAQINIRRRFVDTAFWAPALRTDAQGRATVAVELPDNLTTWRATAVAHTTKTRVGRATHTVIASKDFFVRVETPRLFTQRDRSRILVLVHNETDSPQQTTIRLQVDGLKIEGQDTLTLVVAPRKVERIEVPVTAGPTGPARIRVTAQTSGSDRRQYTDGVELSVPVQPHGRVELAGVAGDVTAERPSTETLRLDPAAIPDATRLSVRITPSITSSIVGALDYLLGFPYGCVEQTMSRFLPTVLVQQALRAHGASDPASAAAIRQMVRDGVTRLYRFQHESGGWGWWEFDDDDPWMTAYVLYGLTSARTAGFEVRDSVVKNAATAALEMAKTARPNTRMFLLYAVALAGDGDGARAARTSVPLKDLGPEGVAYRV